MSIEKYGWRVFPKGKVAHFCLLATAQDRNYKTACGVMTLVPYADFKPEAKKCKKCLELWYSEEKEVDTLFPESKV